MPRSTHGHQDFDLILTFVVEIGVRSGKGMLRKKNMQHQHCNRFFSYLITDNPNYARPNLKIAIFRFLSTNAFLISYLYLFLSANTYIWAYTLFELTTQ